MRRTKEDTEWSSDVLIDIIAMKNKSVDKFMIFFFHVIMTTLLKFLPGIQCYQFGVDCEGDLLRELTVPISSGIL